MYESYRPGSFVLGNETSTRSFPGKNIHCVVVSFPGTKVHGNETSINHLKHDGTEGTVNTDGTAIERADGTANTCVL